MNPNHHSPASLRVFSRFIPTYPEDEDHCDCIESSMVQEQWPHTEDASKKCNCEKIFQTLQNLSGEEPFIDQSSNMLAGYWYSLWYALGNPAISWPAENLIKASGQFEMLHSMMAHDGLVTSYGEKMLNNAMETIIGYRVKELISKNGNEATAIDLVQIVSELNHVDHVHMMN